MVDRELTTAVTKVTRGESAPTHRHHLHADELEALRLEPLDDVSDDAPLHAIGLDGDESALYLGIHSSEETRK